jgi:hypothetical protein
MKESYTEGVANHPVPEPCEGSREAALEGLDRGIRGARRTLPGPATSSQAATLPGLNLNEMLTRAFACPLLQRPVFCAAYNGANRVSPKRTGTAVAPNTRVGADHAGSESHQSSPVNSIKTNPQPPAVAPQVEKVLVS